MDNETHATKSTASAQHAPKPKLTWTEEMEVAGEDLVASIKHLAAEGRVSRIRLIDSDGDIMLEMPLTIGAIAGGAAVLAAPVLAVIGALAVFVTKVKLEVIRNGNPPSDKSH
jgi:Domain of unknown function (DUF4342)